LTDDIRELEREALRAGRCGDYELAVECWRRILAKHDNWEHGYAHYHLADCYTRLGMLDDAEAEYGRAISVAPNDTMFSEALESLKAARRNGLI